MTEPLLSIVFELGIYLIFISAFYFIFDYTLGYIPALRRNPIITDWLFISTAVVIAFLFITFNVNVTIN